MSRSKLVEAYISALPLAAVAIVSSADGQRSRFETGAVEAGAIVSGWANMSPAI